VTGHAALRSLRALGAGLAVAGAAACAGTTRGDRSEARDIAAAQRLVGVWDAVLTADGTAAMSAATPPTQAGGSFAFMEGGGPPSRRLIGMCDVDIRPHHLSPRDAGVPLTAEVRRVPRDEGSDSTWVDSLDILVDEGDGGFLVRMVGTVSGNSASGSWSADSRSAAGGGRFTMRRHRAGVPR
jgi:outer membrane receptor protein involved in Fe transport